MTSPRYPVLLACCLTALPMTVLADSRENGSGFYIHTGMAVLDHRADPDYLRDGGERSFRDGNLGFTLGGGYHVTTALALDIAWIEMDMDRVFSELDGQNLYGRGVRLALDATWAPRQVVGIYGRAGAWHWKTRLRPGFGRSLRRLEGTDPMLEAGLRFGPLAPVSLDIGYGWYAMDRIDTRIISLGLRAHF
ncbi:outer membrane beta-barrel protein [Isoalcanivorax indicus]|uniref:outer membrane beta-barrel protein n=1 Tax=Isoalcanivorax indicus TaxID=2202653 RepID=UPI000DB9392F|nr:outer membrane beta-barrel protein [Isoalcanivorax indicus]